MPNLEQVKWDIQRCTCHVPDACRDCSHYDEECSPILCMEDLLREAYELLTEKGTEAK